MKKFGQSLRTAFHNFWLFISSKIFLKNLTGIILTCAGFVVLVFIFIHFFSRHGQAIETPNITELTLSEAKKKYTYLNFHVDSMYYKDTITGEIPPFLTILAQDPLPKSQIKKGRTIYVNVQQFNKPITALPKIWGNDYERALIMLKDKNLVGKILRKVPDKALNTVLEVYIINNKGDTVEIKPYRQGGTASTIPENSILYLVVAEGLGEEVALPNCRCRTFDLAKFLLDGTELRLGGVFTTADVIDTSAAFIYRQSPEFINGRTVNKGVEVSLWLSKEIPENCSVDSDFVEPEPLVPPPGED